MSADDATADDTLVGIEFPDVFRAQEFLTATTRIGRPPRHRAPRCRDRGQQRRGPRHGARDPRPAAGDDGRVGSDLGRAVRLDPRRTGRLDRRHGGRRRRRCDHGEGRRPRHPRRVGRLVPPSGPPRCIDRRRARRRRAACRRLRGAQAFRGRPPRLRQRAPGRGRQRIREALGEAPLAPPDPATGESLPPPEPVTGRSPD